MKRTAVIVLLLAFGVSACGEDKPTRRIDAVSPAVQVPTWAEVAPEQIAEAKKYGVPVAFENDLGMRFVLIPSGTFVMGSPDSEEGRYRRGLGESAEMGKEEGPQNDVTLSHFYMAVTEVTNAQYRKFKADHAGGVAAGGDDQPVSEVSHEDTTAFVRWLATRGDTRAYRLPTEAQWEYACRAGTTTRFSSGDDVADLRCVGWYLANSNDRPHAVGQKPAVPWGLHDMHGNVWEWCQDTFEYYKAAAVTDPLVEGPDIVRVYRGGSWDSPDSKYARSASRSFSNPRHRDDSIGFRLVSPLPESGK